MAHMNTRQPAYWPAPRLSPAARESALHQQVEEIAVPCPDLIGQPIIAVVEGLTGQARRDPQSASMFVSLKLWWGKRRSR